MSVGDKTDIYNRLISQLPAWFGSNHPNLDAVLAAYVGYVNSQLNTTTYFHYNNQYLYSQLQLRLQTATDINLDLISQDYLGNTLPRYAEETDNTYRARILANVVRPRATLQAMSNAVYLLTGYVPIIYEEFGAYSGFYYGASAESAGYPVTMGYNIWGAYNTNSFPYQFWITVFLNSYSGLGNFPGYNLDYYAGSVAIATAGTGYAKGDTVTLTGGNFTTAIILTVTDINIANGAIVDVSITNAGVYLDYLPSNPLSQSGTSGSGVGAQFNITWSTYTPMNQEIFGYNAGTGWYGSFFDESTNVSENDVLQLIQATKVLGTLQHVSFIYV